MNKSKSEMPRDMAGKQGIPVVDVKVSNDFIAQPTTTVVAALLKICADAVEDDGGTSYNGEEDEIGTRVCCGVLTYEPHVSDCWVPRLRAALQSFKGDNNDSGR